MSDRAVPDSHTGAHDALAVGWALHTLDPEEEADFAAHLETCPTCRQTVDETLETLGELAEAVGPVSPPRHLRRRLLDAVAAESAATGEGIDPARADRGPGGASRPLPSPARDPARRGAGRDASCRSRRRRRASRWLAVAAVALVVAAVGGLAVANQSLRTERDNAAAAAAQAERDAAVVDVLRDAGTPGVTHATLASPDGALVGLVVDDGTGAPRPHQRARRQRRQRGLRAVGARRRRHPGRWGRSTSPAGPDGEFRTLDRGGGPVRRFRGVDRARAGPRPPRRPESSRVDRWERERTGRAVDRDR